MAFVLLTNNPRMQLYAPGNLWHPWSELRPHGVRASLPSSDFSCFFTDAAAVQVLTAGRDLVHYGWRLLHHPLYGNFRPRQQPYRSLLLASPARPSARPEVDGDSLRLVEEAAAVYEAAPGLRPAEVPPALRQSCSLLDHELLRYTLDACDIRPATELVTTP